MDNGFTYIYSLSHPLTGEVRYVGKADNPKLRLYGHIHDPFDNSKSKWIKGIIALGLKPTVEVVDTVSKDSWVFWETYYVCLFKSWGFDLTNKPSASSDDKKKKISIANKKAFKDPDVRAAISKRLMGRRLLETTKAKLSAINSGDRNPFYGKPLSKQHRENISKSQQGRVFSDETRKRMSEGQKEYRRKLREGML